MTDLPDKGKPMTVQRAKREPATVHTDSSTPAGQAAAGVVTPDELMERFQGRGFLSIALFTIVVHTVVILGWSVPFLMKTVRGTDTSKLSEKERLDIAVREATESLRNIAQEHGLSPQDITNRFGSSSPRPATVPTEAPKPVVPAPGTTPPEPEKPKSTIEKELEVKAKGPTVPKVEDEKDDLFR